jgi:hypothetical protein
MLSGQDLGNAGHHQVISDNLKRDENFSNLTTVHLRRRRPRKIGAKNKEWREGRSGQSGGVLSRRVLELCVVRSSQTRVYSVRMRDF